MILKINLKEIIVKTKLFMFDLDGTLCNTDKVNYLAYKKALNDEGYDMDFEYFQTKCSGRNYLEFIPPISSNDKDFLNKIHNNKKQYYKLFLSEAKLNTKLVDFIKKNKHNTFITLNTTASRENCMDILNHFGIVDLFDSIVTKEDVVNVKPDPECYIKPVEFYGIDRKNCEIFEDSECGIKTAYNAGIKCNKVVMPPIQN